MAFILTVLCTATLTHAQNNAPGTRGSAESQGLLLRLSIAGRPVELQLYPNTTLLAGNYTEGHIKDGRVEPKSGPPASAACLYRGTVTVAGQVGSSTDAAAVNVCDGFGGLVSIDGNAYIIEPTGRAGWVRVRHLLDPGPGEEVSIEQATLDPSSANTPQVRQQRALTTPTKYLELVLVEDSQMVTNSGGVTQAMAKGLELANIADALFRNGDLSTSIAIVVTAQYAVAESIDPWSVVLNANGGVEVQALLDNFTNWVSTSPAAPVGGDVRYLLSGFGPDGSTIGYAYTWRVCDQVNNTGLGFTADLSNVAVGTTMAHELGHLLGMGHDGEERTIGFNPPNSCPRTGFIMAAAEDTTNPSTHWSTCSDEYLQAQLARLVADNNACLDNNPTVYAAWVAGPFSTCAATGSGGTQTRSVTCQDSTGAIVADTFCTEPKPATSQACNLPPVARCQNVTINACGAVPASIDNGSSDPDSGDTITLAQVPAGPYGLGITPVTLTVTDSQGASSSCQATVTVADQTPPTITCPSVQSAIATSSSGAVVSFSPSAGDNCDTIIPVCTPPSGSTFPVGTTTVNCNVTDGAGLQSSCSFTVTVTADTLVQLNGLISTVMGLPVPNAVKVALKAPLLVAKVALERHQPQTACGALRVFEGVVTTLRRANKLTVAQATQLTTAAQSLRRLLGCP